MAKKEINPLSLLPRSVKNATEVTDLNAIKELLKDRSIVASDRFILKPGKYEFEQVTAAEWTIGKGKDAKQAVMAVVGFKDGSMTTIGSLRKVDAGMKTYGPSGLPVNEAELLEEIIDRGIEVTEVVSTTFTVFEDGERTVDSNDPSGYKTKPGSIMRWQFAKPAKK